MLDGFPLTHQIHPPTFSSLLCVQEIGMHWRTQQTLWLCLPVGTGQGGLITSRRSKGKRRGGEVIYSPDSLPVGSISGVYLSLFLRPHFLSDISIQTALTCSLSLPSHPSPMKAPFHCPSHLPSLTKTRTLCCFN